ncbi:MAG: SDR family oxidoreductase [Porticoccaceae bacterium]|jgi:NAD(P)-dependent dehydrogenase (short-subunit alcohol dehydrogenase family)|nr:SDR family oxidoreductase [Porticoccaceae bacterium]MEA3301452.1 SDR family oxidoreductase [Pseudomonadota bacterium]
MGTVNPNPSFTGKRALVTGAATGLGKQVATRLVAAGAKVALLGRTRDRLEALAMGLGPAALPLVADVADPDQVRAAFDRVDEALGGLDILINNAAVYIPFRIEHASDEALERIVRTNLMGPMYCIREAVPRMKHSGGDILNISSESTRNPFPFLTVYAAAKGGLETLSLGLRTELREYGIRVALLRVGTMKGEDANASLANWTPEQLQDALALWERTGHNAFSGAGMDNDTVAAAVLHALALPREANMDLFEVRSA